MENRSAVYAGNLGGVFGLVLVGAGRVCVCETEEGGGFWAVSVLFSPGSFGLEWVRGVEGLLAGRGRGAFGVLVCTDKGGPSLGPGTCIDRGKYKPRRKREEKCFKEF